MSMQLGFIGFGVIAHHQLRACQLDDRFSVAAICEVDKLRRAAIPSSIRAFGTLDDMLATSAIDAALVSTPTPTHHEIALRCIEAGIPVIVEKPLALTQAAFEEIFSAGQRRKIPVVGLLHSAFGMEIEALRSAIARLTEPFVWFIRLHDPYAGRAEESERYGSLVGPWIDSGINALSIIRSVVPASSTLELIDIIEIRSGDQPYRRLASKATFSLNGASKIRVAVSWRGPSHSKSSQIRSLNSEDRIYVDHAVPFLKTKSTDGCLSTQVFDSRLPRLTLHYIRALQDAWRLLSERKSNRAFCELAYQPYFAALRSLDRDADRT